MIDEVLAYQEADGRLRAIEQKISATDERKKYVTARKFLEKAPEKLDALDARAAEFKRLFTRLQKKSEELAEAIKDYENLGEMIGQQGGEIAFYKKNASQIADSLRGLKAEIARLRQNVEEAAKEYAAAKKQTIAMQRQYKEYREKYNDIKKEYAAEVENVESELKKLGEKVPKDTLAKYTAKRKEKLYPVVCEVKAKDNRCPQCGMELSIAEQSKLESGTFIECDSCRRILFRRK